MIQVYNLFSIVRHDTLIMSQKGNETTKLRHPKKEIGTINLRWKEYILK